MDLILRFAYINTSKELSIKVVHYIRQDEKYLQGIDLTPECDKKLKTFLKDRIIQQFDSEKEADSYKLENNLNTALEVLAKTRSKKTESKVKIDTFDIHFTGFKQADKERLIKLAEDKDLTIRQSVTQDLQLLCVGYNASIKKMEKAQSMGISIMNERDFLNFLETGEILFGE